MSISRTPSVYSTFPTLAEGSQTTMSWSMASSFYRLPSIRPRHRDFVDYAGPILFIIFVVCAIAIAYTGGASIPPPPIHRHRSKGHILVTGFEAQKTNSSSPSLAVARSLNNSCEGIMCFEAFSVRATPIGVATAVSKIRDNNYVAVLMLDFKHASKGFKLEVVARNIMQTTQTTNTSELYHTEAIPNAPRLLATTAPLDRLSLKLLKPRFDVDGLWSNDVSSTADNELYYRTLHIARNVKMNDIRKHVLKPTLLVHVPSLNTTSMQDVVSVIKNLAMLIVR